MIQLVESNDPVLISFVASLLADAGIRHSVTDAHMSVIEGSIGAVTNRVLVADADEPEARRLLVEAGVRLEEA
jgi:hypothetical protein